MISTITICSIMFLLVYYLLICFHAQHRYHVSSSFIIFHTLCHVPSWYVMFLHGSLHHHFFRFFSIHKLSSFQRIFMFSILSKFPQLHSLSSVVVDFRWVQGNMSTCSSVLVLVFLLYPCQIKKCRKEADFDIFVQVLPTWGLPPQLPLPIYPSSPCLFCKRHARSHILYLFTSRHFLYFFAIFIMFRGFSLFSR